MLLSPVCRPGSYLDLRRLESRQNFSHPINNNMETAELLGTSFNCGCGKRHAVPTEDFVYGENAFAAIPGLIERHSSDGRCLIVADARTHEVAGREIKESGESSGARCRHFIVPDLNGESPAVDDTTRDLLLSRTGDSSLFIALGSGVINDLVKCQGREERDHYLCLLF